MRTLNERAHELCNAMVADADTLGIAVSTLDCGTRIIDCGVKAPGSIEAGMHMASICMSGLGRASLGRNNFGGWNGHHILTFVDDPVTACMASQYAGWEINGEKFFAMGSGPMRAAACREELFKHIGHCERAEVCVGVLETSKIPTDRVCEDLAEKCRVAPNRLTLLVARTASEAGTVQIVARSVETALHKLHLLEFDLNRILFAEGVAPLPPVAADDLTAVGWTNDAILYGALVVLHLTRDNSTIAQIGPRVPSNASPDYGRPFGEIFNQYGGDFYRIDPMLFSPARIVFDVESCDGAYSYGQYAPEVLAESFAKK